MTRISAVFADGPALIPYIVAGDPFIAATEAHLDALIAGGADIIELGLPFSEPIADGPTIQAGINRALTSGTTPDRFFDLVESLTTDIPLVVMTYYNLIYQYGDTPIESFVSKAAASGINGIIVPDLPVEESSELKQSCINYDVDLIFIVAPTTTDDRLAKIMDQVTGFVYVQARLGTTGAQTTVSQQTHQALSRLKSYTVPKAVGFGVSTADQATEIIRAGADGIVAGSVFVDIIQSETDVPDRLEAKTRELKQGVIAGIESPEPEHK